MEHTPKIDAINSKTESGFDLGYVIETIAPLPIKAKIELLQLVNGIRPVADITVIPEFREQMIPAIEKLKEMGLAVVSKKTEKGPGHYYLVSKNPLFAQEALNTRDPRRFGELMGFPQDSINAFLTEQDDPSEIREKAFLLKTGFEDHCLGFRWSSQFTSSEVEYVRQSYRILLEQAPWIIDEALPLDVDKEAHRKKIAKFVYGELENSL